MRTQKKGTQIKRAAILNLLLFVFVYAGCKQPSVTVNSYPVSFSAIGGTVTASVDGKAITNGEFVGAGKTVTFTAHPQSGMKVSRWTGIENAGDKGTVSLTVKAGVSVTAECTAIMHTVTFTQPEHGNLTASIDGKDFTGGTVAEGKTVLFKAEPDKGYTVKQWTGAGKEGCTDTTVGLIVEKESAVSVEFIDIESLTEKYTVSFTKISENGTLSAKLDGADFSGGAVQKGKTVVFTAAPAAGYRVKKWTGTDNPASTDKTAVLTVKENAAVSVEFESAVIPVQKFEITLTPPTANGSVSAKVDGKPLTFTENKAQVEKGKTVVFTAVPAAGYRVKKWTGTDNPASTDKTVVLTVKENAAVSVEFEYGVEVIPVPKFNVIFDTPQNGTLTASLDGAPFTGGEVEKDKIIIFTAEPDPTYRVRKWTGWEDADTQPIRTLTVTKAVHVLVEFINVPEYRITFSQPEHGSLTATLDGASFDGTQKVAEGKHIVFTAIPETGYRLLKWENVNTDPEHGYVKVHTVKADKTVSVTFETDDILTIRKDWQGYYVESCKTTAEGVIEVPAYVQYIGYEAFKGCVKVTEVKLPAGLTKIKSAAFSGCTGLTSISLPAGLTEIGSDAFSGCTGLTSITIPAELTEIGTAAFRGCTGLTSISLPAGLTQIGNDAFLRCTGLTSINLPASVTKIESGAFSSCTGLTNITLPAGLTKIESSTFRGCTGLTSITLPAGLTKIESSTFRGCTGLTSITLPASVTQIEQDAFGGCTGLTSISFPADLTKIGSAAFRGCTGLTSVSLPAGLTKIEYSTFRGCTGLTSITLPAGLTKIEEDAFRDCTGLTSITLPADLTKIGSAAFYGCTGLTSITLPAGLTKIEEDAFRDCTGLTSITLPADLTKIGRAAFSGCTGLTSITLPSGLTKIGSTAFYNCKGLKDITIEAVNITEIESNPFYNIHAEARFKVKSGGNVKQKLIDYGIDASKIIEQP